MEKDYKKELTLKHKSLIRLMKEYNSYVKEVDQINKKIEKMKDEKKEDWEYNVKKSEEFLQESIATRDAVKGKFRGVLDDLINLTNDIQDEELKSSEDFSKANETINQCVEIFKGIN